MFDRKRCIESLIDWLEKKEGRLKLYTRDGVEVPVSVPEKKKQNEAKVIPIQKIDRSS